MNDATAALLDEFVSWASQERSIQVVILFGSLARESAQATGTSADAWSDIDLHVVTSCPRQFATREWTRIFPKRELWAYAYRRASGNVSKATVLFKPGIELDVVVVPAWSIRLARTALATGLDRKIGTVGNALDELSTIMKYGYRVLKGSRGWDKFYAGVVSGRQGARMNDDAVRALAEEFVCDFVSLGQKIERGEYVAAQRILHRSLAETNFRLLHELRLRRGSPSYREARRVERLISREELSTISVTASLEPAALRAAKDQCAAGFRELMGQLVGETWRWPELPSTLR